MRYNPGDEFHSVLREWLKMLEKGIGCRIEDVISEAMRTDAKGRFAYRYIRRNLAEADGLVTEQFLIYARMMAEFETLRDKLGDAYDELSLQILFGIPSEGEEDRRGGQCVAATARASSTGMC